MVSTCYKVETKNVLMKVPLSLSETSQDLARPVKTWRDQSRLGETSQDLARPVKTWRDQSRLGETSQDLAGHVEM